WGLLLPPLDGFMMFHVVTSGRCWLEAESGERCALAEGDLALVPHGHGHRMASAPGVVGRGLFDLPREEVSERYEILRQDGGGEESTLVCGTVRFDNHAARHLLAVLPGLIRVEAAKLPEADWIRSTLALAAAEARTLRPGGDTVVTRLADVLVIHAIRSWIEEDQAARTGWIGALADRQIGRAIQLIHREPARPWTVAGLAREVAMSRSAFAAR